MKQLYIKCSVLLLIMGFLAGSDQEHSSNNYFTLHSARLVQKRYYLIHRLEEPVKTLKLAMHEDGTVLLDPHVVDLFRHPLLRVAVQTILATKKIDSFCKVWNDVLAYKELENNLFTRETIILLLLLYKQRLISLPMTTSREAAPLVNTVERVIKKNTFAEGGEHTKTVISYKEPAELEKILFSGHHIPLTLCEGPVCHNIYSNINILIALLAESDECDTDIKVVGNSMRFYHIQRLLRAMLMLSKYNKDFTFSSEFALGKFKNLEVLKCAQAITETKKLKPLFKLWTTFAAYEFLNDETFVSEFTQLIVEIYAQLLSESTKKSLTVNVLQFYSIVNELPMPELLELMDDLVDQFSTSVKDYELDNTTLTWLAWLRKYWWAPPEFINSFIITLMRHKSTLQKVVELFLTKKSYSTNKTRRIS